MTSPCSKGEAGLLHTHICQALADRTRLLILYALADRPRLVGELGDALGLPQSSISRHLKVLRDQSLVHARHEGAAVRYSLADRRVIEALDLLRSVVHDSLLEKARLGDAAAVATSPPA
jgi:ArsR family transcriptional regulator